MRVCLWNPQKGLGVPPTLFALEPNPKRIPSEREAQVWRVTFKPPSKNTFLFPGARMSFLFVSLGGGARGGRGGAGGGSLPPKGAGRKTYFLIALNQRSLPASNSFSSSQKSLRNTEPMSSTRLDSKGGGSPSSAPVKALRPYLRLIWAASPPPPSPPAPMILLSDSATNPIGQPWLRRPRVGTEQRNRGRMRCPSQEM